MGQLASAMPQAVTVTPEEREAIERVSLSTSLAVFTFVSVFDKANIYIISTFVAIFLGF